MNENKIREAIEKAKKCVYSGRFCVVTEEYFRTDPKGYEYCQNLSHGEECIFDGYVQGRLSVSSELDKKDQEIERLRLAMKKIVCNIEYYRSVSKQYKEDSDVFIYDRCLNTIKDNWEPK